MNPTMILYFLRLILCNAEFLKWLENEANKTDTPIDNYAVSVIKFLLCPGK